MEGCLTYTTIPPELRIYSMVSFQSLYNIELKNVHTFGNANNLKILFCDTVFPYLLRKAMDQIFSISPLQCNLL